MSSGPPTPPPPPMAAAGALPPPLSAAVVGSFAYLTVRDRLPVILARAVDAAHRRRHHLAQTHGQAGAESLIAAVGRLSALRYSMSTDKPLDPTVDCDVRGDARLWNAALRDNREALGEANATWFKSPWLLIECLMYRKIADAFLSHEHTRDLDPFCSLKEEAFAHALPAMAGIALRLVDVVQQLEAGGGHLDVDAEIERFLMVSLWGNQHDLSISSGAHHSHADTDAFARLETLRPRVLNAANAARALSRLSAGGGGGRPVHVVLDNAGLELFADLCLAELLLAAGRCTAVVFHAKCAPWFVSDTTMADFAWTLQQLRASTEPPLAALGHKWHRRAEGGAFSLRADRFWTLPHAFHDMKSVAPELYDELSRARLVIFKGDLNYRKLVGDLDWPVATAYTDALRAFDLPHCALRTLKSPVCVGITDAEAERCRSAHGGAERCSWMCDGSYAIVAIL